MACETTRNFAGSTSIHGVQHAVIGSRACRVVWTVVTVGCLSIAGFQLFKLFSAFLSKQTTVSIQLTQEPAPFPAVTFCNLNNYRMSKAREVPEVFMAIMVFEQVVAASLAEKSGRRKRATEKPKEKLSSAVSILSSTNHSRPPKRRQERASLQSPDDCPDGFTNAGVMCYSLEMKDRVNFEEALQYCSDLGARLPVLRTQAESTAAHNYIQSFGVNSVYIGIDDTDRNGRFVWHDAIDFFDWGNFNVPIYEPCAVMLLLTGKSQTVTCDTLSAVVCQAPRIRNAMHIDGCCSVSDKESKAVQHPVSDIDACLSLASGVNCLYMYSSAGCWIFQPFDPAAHTYLYAYAPYSISMPLAEQACSYVGYVQNGNLPVYDLFVVTAVNTSVHFSCIDKYALRGPRTRTCLTGGTWSESNPLCIPVCQPVQLDPQFSVTYSSSSALYEGTVATYACKASTLGKTYWVTPVPKQSVCQNDHTWADPLPVSSSCICKRFTYALFGSQTLCTG